MDFNFLSFCNNLLMIMKRPPITSFGTKTNADEYRARTAINAVIQDMALVLRIKTRQTTFEITTVASQRLYTIQKRIVYPFGNLRQKVTDLVIHPMNPIEFDRFIPDDQGTGTPEVHYFEKFSGVTNQPASAGEVVYVVSDSGADSTGVVVQGYDTNDNYVADEITLSGTSSVASTSTFKTIESVSKIATSGTITFRNSGSTTTYETLSPQERHSRRLTIGLHPIPGSAITIFGRGWVQMPPLVNEHDVPVGFSFEHVNAIMAGAYYHYMKYDPAFKQEGSAQLKQDYYDEISKIIGQDANDRIQYAMKSAYGRRVAEFLPLSRNYFR